MAKITQLKTGEVKRDRHTVTKGLRSHQAYFFALGMRTALYLSNHENVGFLDDDRRAVVSKVSEAKAPKSRRPWRIVMWKYSNVSLCGWGNRPKELA